MSTELCWVLTEAEHPFRITAASDVWYATWQLTPDNVIGETTKVLDGPGCDKKAGRLLMEQFAARGAATQRCTNVRSDGTLIKHTVSLVRAQGGLLAISTDMDGPDDIKVREGDGHATLLDVSAKIASSMHAERERAGGFAVSPADIAAAALDELEDAIDELDLIKEDLSTREKPVEAWGSADGSSSKAVATESVPAPTQQKAHKAPTGGSGSYDSTMTNFEAEARAARAISRHARAITTRMAVSDIMTSTGA